MATSTSRRAHPRRAVRAKLASPKKKIKRALPIRRKAAKPHRVAVKKSQRPVTDAASAVLKSFAKLLRSLTADAAQLTAEQRTRLKKAMKHAHAALD